MFERSSCFSDGTRSAAGAQPRVDVIFDTGNLKPRGDLEQTAAFGNRQRRPGRIVKIRREDHHLDAVLHEHRFDRGDVHAGNHAGAGFRLHRDSQNSGARSGKNGQRPGIRRIFEQNRIARAQERFADQIERLLAAIGDQQIFVARFVSLRAQAWRRAPASAAGYPSDGPN